MKIWIFSTDFREILEFQILWKSVHWEPSSLRTDERTDTTKLIVAFCNSANAPKNINSLVPEDRDAGHYKTVYRDKYLPHAVTNTKYCIFFHLISYFSIYF